MAEARLPIFIHPTVPLNRNFLSDPIPIPAFAFLVDSTLAALRLAASGILSNHADAPIILPHGGATIPYVMGRVSSMVGQPEAQESDATLTDALKRLYMDAVVYEPEPLEFCLSFMGASQILLGTDHPYGDWRKPTRLLEEASYLSSQEREQVEAGNARRLFALRG